MKKRIGVLTVIVILTFLLSTASVFAQSVNFNGSVSGNTKAVSVLVTHAGANLSDLQISDIVYINQAKVSGGTFSVKMPLFDGEYETHSNVGEQYTLSEIPKHDVYLSASGNDANDGLTSGAPKRTFANIYQNLDEVRDIILLTDMTFSMPSGAYEGTLSVKGSTGNEQLSVSGMNLKGNLTLDNLVLNGTNAGGDGVSCYIFANGFSLEMGDRLTSTGRITVYGGKSGETVASTDLKLYGGQYKGIYAGGYNGAVTGDTHVIVGGNVNPSDGVDDSNSSTLSPTYVYGGCYGAAVGGKTYVAVTGNATVNTVSGAGNGAAGTVTDTNITLAGGRVMNVYGGGLSGGAALTNCNTHITVTGGSAEGIFGASEEKAMTGNTYITLAGGEVTRRVFGGCYNESSSGAKYVTGSTVIEIFPEASLCTGTGLSWINRLDSGIYAGSRNVTNAAEKNYMIFSNGSYSVQNTHTEKAADYTLNVSSGGTVSLDGTNAQITCLPDMGRGSVVNNQRVENAALISGLNTIVFEGITNASAQKQQNGVTGSAGVSVNESHLLIAGVYDLPDNELLGVQMARYSSGTNTFNLNIDNCTFEEGKRYVVRLFVWKGDGSLLPLTTAYVIDLN